MTYPFSKDVVNLNPELAAPAQGKRRKYGNVPVGTFDSGKEYRDWQQLILETKAGEHIAIFHHVRFPLQGGIIYEADFMVLENDLSVRVLDSKGGPQTREFRLKRKLFRERYSQEIELI